jgi:hypothetical protein
MRLPSSVGREPAYLMFAAAGLGVADAALDWRTRSELEAADIAFPITMALCGLQVLRVAAGLIIHQHGIQLGNLPFAWNEIGRWAKSRENGEVHFWTNSPWRYLAMIRPSSPLKFKGELTADAEHVLRQRIPASPSVSGLC